MQSLFIKRLDRFSPNVAVISYPDAAGGGSRGGGGGSGGGDVVVLPI